MFSDEEYEGFMFVQDLSSNMNDSGGDIRQLDPSRQSINCRCAYEQETNEEYL